MKEFTILKILDRFRPLFEKMKMDYDILRRILQMKLIMDARRTPIIIGNQKKKDNDRNQFLTSMWLYALLGLFLLPTVLINQNIVYQMSMFFGVLIFLVMTSLISDFSSVLLDTKDKEIILSKPVDGRTLGMAKIIHISIYLLFITLCLAGPSLVAGLIKYGILFFVAFLIELLLVNLLIIVITALLYMMILRFFDGEKLKNIINYVQIGLTITMAIGYQFLIRVFDYVHFEAVFNPKWWHYLIIPVWYGAPYDLVMNGNSYSTIIVFTTLAVIVPIIAISLYIKWIPIFERNLLKLSAVSNSNRRKKSPLSSLISRWLCKSGEERIFYHFTKKMIKNEREFKLKVYPSLGLSIVFPFIFLITSFKEFVSEGSRSSELFLLLYFSGLVIPNVIYMLKYSSNYKASWIYKCAPITNMGAVLKGSI